LRYASSFIFRHPVDDANLTRSETLHPNSALHVVLRWDGPGDEDVAWRTNGNPQFEAAYAPEDAIYDQLINPA
jgi:hypothetical protein